jgi:hypothetical protein
MISQRLEDQQSMISSGRSNKFIMQTADGGLGLEPCIIFGFDCAYFIEALKDFTWDHPLTKEYAQT